ncbi:DivIVA domain-containing protein [Nonomuraea sp. NPDC052265]|uniref:DivIVA domain-containing protein n=1 Tax=Nonomuraea sp. NPDC052265 TaxID=3364374 RepID=UPI0037CC10E4
MHAEHEEHDHGHEHDRGLHLPHSHAALDGATTPPLPAGPSGRLALLTASAVHHQVFTVVRLRSGYDLAEVDAFLAQVETTLNLLWQDNTQLRERLGAAPPASTPTDAGVLAAAHRSAQEALESAQREARQILAEAHADAEHLRREATSAADALTHATRQALDEQIGRLERAITEQGRSLQHNLHTQLGHLRAALADLDTHGPPPTHAAHDAASPRPLPERSHLSTRDPAAGH